MPLPLHAAVEEVLPTAEALYEDLHRHPELSLEEERTAATLAARLRALGVEVTTGVGGHGVVGVLRNGAGPTVLLRTDMDALPIREETGLACASTAIARDPAGGAVPVMHACGHDAHMASWIGAATVLAGRRRDWHGTVVLMAQPAEELARGAKAMIADGLLSRFPRPDHALAIHVTAALPAGRVAVPDGPVFASANTVEVVVRGRGAHGAAPHRGIDPVLIAARLVVSLQGIVAREIDPLDPAVVTVGAIHGGTRPNVIPDAVTLQLTVRSYGEDVQRRLLAAIERMARAEAALSAAPDPSLAIAPDRVAATVNDPALAERVGRALRAALGEDAVAPHPPVMGSEDFSELGLAGIPAVMMWVGAARDEATARLAVAGEAPGPHSARFAPEARPTLRTGIAAFTGAALELLAPA